MTRSYYRATLSEFLAASSNEILGVLTGNSDFPVVEEQRDAWIVEIQLLQDVLKKYDGTIYFEYSIPRMGRRIDVLLLLECVIFVLEFKVGDYRFSSDAKDQVFDYGLDLKNFHETSYEPLIAPILIATEAVARDDLPKLTPHNDNLFCPIQTNGAELPEAIDRVLSIAQGPRIDASAWEKGRYRPTPTIIEAAMALYNGHSVKEISRSDASAINLAQTTDAIGDVIRTAKEKSQKSIVFVTGVPGAGKTLVGLNIATTYLDRANELYSVFLSGNGPLVAILREALARDKVRHEREHRRSPRKSVVMNQVKSFVQNVHTFRDEYLRDKENPPIEHVTLFDEAQRAWTREKTADFMKRRKKIPGFSMSEPEFLISCLNRHKDWAVIVCLVGGGQEIHTGEAGIGEWIESLNRSFRDWKIYISSRLTDSEYGAGKYIVELESRRAAIIKDDLHLAVSMRSFRAENVSLLVKQLLDLEDKQARQTLNQLSKAYPIVLTRDIQRAKNWLKSKARGTERYGMVVSSQAERLRPQGIFVKSPMDPVHWFLDGKEDVRSSYYLEDVATEFSIQGLELDWVCVTWDADFRHSKEGWVNRSFVGDRWNKISKGERQVYQKNAYRVLLTRARQGMVIVVPDGDPTDPTRLPEFYDPTFRYLQKIGFETI
jgi:hypothetical protein